MYSSNPIEVAYADDHAIVRKGICELLNSLGEFRISIEADNGKHLIDQLLAAEQVPSICILDISMPIMDGLETIGEVRQRWPGMKFLVLTGHNTDYYLIKMIVAGANGYLLKNCSPRELQEALHAIHEQGVYHSELMNSRTVSQVMRREINPPEFTEREIELMRHCCSDLSYLKIAEQMGITLKSLDWARNSVFKKLNVTSRSGLVLFALQKGLVPLFPAQLRQPKT